MSKVSLHSQQSGKDKVSLYSRQIWLILLLAYLILGIILYANSLDNSFHYDDNDVIFQDEEIHNRPRLIDAWTTAFFGNKDSVGQGHYRPLVFTTYLLNYSVSGLDPKGYHAVNILVHILTAFLVALVMERLTGQLMAGALSGLIFLVHPFNSEAVNYVTARSSQLYALFYLLAFYAYMRYRPPSFSSENLGSNPPVPPFLKGGIVNSPFEKGGLRGIYFWMGLSLVSFVLSMLSKEMAVTLPVTLFLYEWLIGPATKRIDRLRGLWIPAGFGIIVTVSYLLVRRMLSGAVLPPDTGRNLMSQLATEGVVLVKTLGLILWPANLTVDHRVEVYKTFLNWPVAGACIVLVGCLVLFLWLARSADFRKRFYAFLLAWFFVALSPLVVLRLNHMLQENRAYLATVGVVGLMCAGLVFFLDWARGRGGVLLKGFYTGIMILVLIYAALTIQRNIVWQDEISLWTDAVYKNPYSAIALDNLGVAYRQLGRLEDANEQFRAALRLDPYRFVAAYNLGLVADRQDKYSEAEYWYRRTLQLVPRFYKARLMLGLLYERQGHSEEAIHEYTQVINIYPELNRARLFLGDALFKTGRYQEVAREYAALLQKGSLEPKQESEVRTRLVQIREMGYEVK